MYGTTTDIANAALMHIGETSIASIEGSEANAKRCRAALLPAQRLILAAHPWAWKTVLRELAEVTNDLPDQWTYRHVVPPDCARIRGLIDAATGAVYASDEIENDGWSFPGLPYERVNQDRLYSHLQRVRLRFVRDQGAQEEPTTWAPVMQEALVWAIAERIVFVITKTRTQKEQAIEMARAALSEAIAWDANQNANRSADRAQYQMARELPLSSPFGGWRG